MRFWVKCVVAAWVMGGSAVAEPVSGADARKALFAVRGVDLALVRDSGLDAGQETVVQAILQQLEAGGSANYYGAVAISPLFFEMMTQDPAGAASSGLLQVAEKFHNARAASVAALSACEAARQENQAQCVVAAQILPKNWTAQPLQMSVEATEAFKEYRKGRGPKFMAISPATTAFAYAKGDGAATVALTQCNQRSTIMGQSDCIIVIED